jgi:hypothetical protein
MVYKLSPFAVQSLSKVITEKSIEFGMKKEILIKEVII